MRILIKGRKRKILFKLAHLSDIHAGYRAYNQVNTKGVNLREADGYRTFYAIVSDVIEQKVDAVLIAGDTFHTPTPEIRTILFIQGQLRRFFEAGIPVYILAGNHDTNDIRSDIAASKVLDDPFRKIFSHAEPYAVHEIAPGIFLHMVSHHMYSDQKATMSQVVPVPGAVNIFTTHGSVIDPLLHHKLHTEQSPREIVIPDNLLTGEDWSYTLLGHIHERGWTGSKDKKNDTSNTNVYYNGSIIRRGFADKDVPLGRGWTLWTVDGDGTFLPTFRNVPQRPQYDFAPIDAEHLSSSDITDLVLRNLQATQTDGTTFNPGTAPILRQVITGITAAKKSSMDWKAIDLNSHHALSFHPQTLPILSESSPDRPTGEDVIADNSDMLNVYDGWVEKAPVVVDLSEDIREDVKKTARNFVQLGQEEILDAE